MTCYLIRQTLDPCSFEEIRGGGTPFVALLTGEEWRAQRDSFSMGIDMEPEPRPLGETRAVVNYDSLTGSISIPDLGYVESLEGGFSFALDEKGVVFIDDAGLAGRIVGEVSAAKRWREPGLARFLYDFLEHIIQEDLPRLGRLEHHLEEMEAEILADESEEVLPRLNDVRGKLLDLHFHYGQLAELGEVLEENENRFFPEADLRYFRLFIQRVERLRDTVVSLRDYTVQLRDLIQTRVDVRQNRIMTLLTVVTTIFTPLTLLTGWYGMNFRYMPELEYRASYPIVIVVSLLIAGGCLLWFKKKKWL